MDDGATWSTWALAVLAWVPGITIAAGYVAPADGGAFSLVLAGAHTVGLVSTLVAIPVFTGHLFGAAGSSKSSTGTIVGFGLAFLAAPVGTYTPAVLPFVDAAAAWPTVLGWAVTLAALPLYWLRFIKPSPASPDL